MQRFPTWLIAGLNEPFQLKPRIEWSPDWEHWFPLRPLSGSHGQNRTQQFRWQFQGTFAKDYDVSEQGIHPYGCRARIFLGVKTLRNPVFWFPQGVYSVVAAEENEAAISITGNSFEIDVAQSDFVQTRRIPDRRFQTYRSVAETLISEAVPDARFYWSDALLYGETCPVAYLNTGRWAAVSGTEQDISIMRALGGEGYCDANGAFRFVPTPTLDDAPVWRVAKGGALVGQARSFDREDVANVVGAGGDSADGTKSVGPVFAWDASPTSITYAGVDPVNRPGVDAGRFGVKPITYTSPLIDNEVQAGIVARAQLADKLGLHYNLALTSRFHPGVEAGDVIEVETYKGQVERHLLDGINYTWGAADMACEVRTPKQVFSTSSFIRVKATIASSDEQQTPADDEAGGNPEPPPVTPPADNGDEDDAPVTVTKSKSYTATGGRAFGSDGSTHSTSQLYQGYYSGTWGNNRSLVSFNYSGIQADMTGKTIKKCTLKFRVRFSYYNAGMTAVIGTHNSTSITSLPSSGLRTNLVRKSNCKAGQWVTVTLPLSAAKALANGSAKGIIFGPGPSTSKDYYGYHYIGGSNSPVLTFTYSYTA